MGDVRDFIAHVDMLDIIGLLELIQSLEGNCSTLSEQLNVDKRATFRF